MIALPADWLQPDWRVSGVGGLMTTRPGASDDADTAARIAAASGAAPVSLRQVHGARVARIGAADVRIGAQRHEADASVTSEVGVACVVRVADCLPVLFAAPGGRAVGAAHAGWRGLAAGVLEATANEVAAAAACEPGELVAWLGACIGPQAFEVGADVLEAFRVDSSHPLDADAAVRFRPGRPGKWLADLPRLARDRLAATGVRQATGGDWCTVSDASRFFSFRRDGSSGRMVAAVWRHVDGRK